MTHAMINMTETLTGTVSRIARHLEREHTETNGLNTIEQELRDKFAILKADIAYQQEHTTEFDPEVVHLLTEAVLGLSNILLGGSFLRIGGRAHGKAALMEALQELRSRELQPAASNHLSEPTTDAPKDEKEVSVKAFLSWLYRRNGDASETKLNPDIAMSDPMEEALLTIPPGDWASVVEQWELHLRGEQ